MCTIIAALVAVVAMLCLLDRARADSCPESCVFSFCSTLAQRDTFLSYSPGYATASYDLTVGIASARGGSGFDGAFIAPAVARDRFTLLGPGPAGPIAFTGRLHVVGAASVSDAFFSAYVDGSLQEGSNPPVRASAGTGGSGENASLDQHLSLPLQHAVGEAFELIYTASARGHGRYSNANSTGQLSFSGLPTGYWLVSCQGFSTAPVVPVRGVTWGSLKVIYR